MAVLNGGLLMHSLFSQDLNFEFNIINAHNKIAASLIIKGLMLIDRKLPPTHHVLFLNYTNLQQNNSIKIHSIQEEQTEESLHIPPKLNPSTIDTRNRYLRFYQPYRKFINPHKIIHKNRTKTKPIKIVERTNQAKTVIRRTLSPPIKIVHEEVKGRQQALLVVYDWMMEVAALMRISKNAFFRSVLILQSAAQVDRRLAFSKRINQLACAALAMGCKFQCSQRNYLDEIYQANGRRVSKAEISVAEHCLLKALDWSLPIHVELEETLSLVLDRWREFLRDWGGKFERAVHGKCFHEGRLVLKLYVQAVFVLDFLILRGEWLREGDFMQPILLSIYVLFSISVGDAQLDQYSLWPFFLKFVQYHHLLPDDELIDKLEQEIARCAGEYMIIQALSQIPLTLNLEKLMRKRNEQFYIPKVQCIRD